MSQTTDGAINRSFINEPHDSARFVIWRIFYSFWLPSIVTGTLVTGCQSFQKQGMQESAKCGALCAQAREARAKGNAEQANRYINEALRQRPGDLDSRRQLAETMWNQGRRDESVVIYTSLCEQHPRDGKLAARLAGMLWENGQHSDAASRAATVLQLDSQSKEAWQIRARYEVESGRLDDALVSYLQLNQLDPDDLDTQIELGELHLRRGYPERACPLFLAAGQHMDSTSERRPEIEWLLGVAYARGRRWSVAVSMLEQAINRRNASAEDWCLLSWTRLQSGDLAGAQADLRRAFDRDPDSAAAKQLAHQLEIATDFSTPSSTVTPASYEPGRTSSLSQPDERILEQGLYQEARSTRHGNGSINPDQN